MLEQNDVEGVKDIMKDMEGWEIRLYSDKLYELGIASKYIPGLNAIYMCVYTHVCTHSSRDARF